eukprot:303163-Prymnesium_polylepis.1
MLWARAHVRQDCRRGRLPFRKWTRLGNGKCAQELARADRVHALLWPPGAPLLCRGGHTIAAMRPTQKGELGHDAPRRTMPFVGWEESNVRWLHAWVENRTERHPNLS